MEFQKQKSRRLLFAIKSSEVNLLKSAAAPFCSREHYIGFCDLLHSRCHNRLENKPWMGDEQILTLTYFLLMCLC